MKGRRKGQDNTYRTGVHDYSSVSINLHTYVHLLGDLDMEIFGVPLRIRLVLIISLVTVREHLCMHFYPFRI